MKNIDTLIKKVLKEETQRYMFFSNLEQMKRQIEILLDFDRSFIESVLDDGHDWAQDHIAEAKNNMDQVFDFLMNEKESGKNMEVMEFNNFEDLALADEAEGMDPNKALAISMMEGRKKTGTKLCARGKAAAKAKFEVYPSAYANGFAIQVCKGRMKGLDGKKRCSPPYCNKKKK